MTREDFKSNIKMMQELNTLYEKLYDLGIDTINCKAFEYAGVFFDQLIMKEFGEENYDLVSWWLYEDVDHKIYECTDETKEWYFPGEEIHGKVIADLNDIDDLYNYITKEENDED